MPRRARHYVPAATSPTATASGGPTTPARPGPRSASTTRATWRASASTRRTPTWSTSRRWATSSGRTTSAASSARATAARPGRSVLFVDDRTRAASTSRWIRRTRASSTRASGASRRTPYSLESGGEGSARSGSRTDGGDTWTELTRQRRPARRARSASAASPCRPSNPERVCAIVEAEDGGVFRSRRRRARPGARSTTTANLRQRAWYYTRIYADPQDEDTVYVLNVGFHRSQGRRRDVRAHLASRTATTTTCGSTPTTRSA